MAKFRASMKRSIKGEEIERRVDEAVTKAVYDITDQIFSESQQRAPIDIGFLRKSGVVKYGPGPTATISYTAVHAKPVEFGSKPHMPPVAPIERWAKRHGMPGAGWAIAKKIAERGTKAKPFLQDAIDAVIPRVGEAFRNRIKAVLRR